MDGETKAAIEADCKTFLEGFSKVRVVGRRTTRWLQCLPCMFSPLSTRASCCACYSRGRRRPIAHPPALAPRPPRRRTAQTYATNYKSQLVNKLLEEGGAEEGEEDGPQLASPPSDDSPLRTGLVTKRGAVRKNWKQRFFVVKPNFTVDYYESEAKFEAAAKPKGCMVLNGYSVVRDPNARKVDAKTEMYKKLDLEEEAGEYTKYEPLTLELFHPSRRRWLMKFTEQADFDSWADTFEECCRKVDGRSTDDEVTCGAYDAAFGKCQEDMGLADHTYKGSEADMLTDLLYDDVDRKHLGAVREKLPGQGKMKVMAEGKMSSAVRAICNGLAVASWKTMVTASDASRPKVEEGLGAAIGPVRTAKGDVVGKTTEATSSVTAPVQEKVLVPVAAAIAKPVLLVAQAMFRRAIPVFQAQADAVGEQAAEKGDVQAADLPAASDIKERLSEARGAAGEAADTLGSLMGDAPELPEPVMAAINKIESVLNLKEWMQDTEDMVQSLAQKAIYT